MSQRLPIVGRACLRPTVRKGFGMKTNKTKQNKNQTAGWLESIKMGKSFVR